MTYEKANIAVGGSGTYDVITPLITDSPVQIMASARFNSPTKGDELVGELVKVQ